MTADNRQQLEEVFPGVPPRWLVDKVVKHYPELADADFPENFGAIVEEALAHHDYAIVSTASRLIHELRERYRPNRA